MTSATPDGLPSRRLLNRSVPLLVPPVLAVVALAAACGGGSTNSSAAASTTTTTLTGRGAFGADRAKFTSCLESHGVPASEATAAFPRRGGSFFGGTGAGAGGTPPSTSTPPSTLSPTLRAAFTACRSDLPVGGGGGFNRAFNNVAYRQCLQVHGVTLPSIPPTTSATGTPGGGSGFAGLLNNPQFRAAQTACASLLPSGGRSTSSTTAAP